MAMSRVMGSGEAETTGRAGSFEDGVDAWRARPMPLSCNGDGNETCPQLAL